MSDYTKTGRHFRPVAAVAILAVAMMALVPIVTVAGSDAAFNEDKAGLALNMVNPTDDELKKYDMDSKTKSILNASYLYIDMFNLSVYGSSDVKTEYYEIEQAESIKIESDSEQVMVDEETYTKGVQLTLTAIEDGDLIGNYSSLSSDYRKAADAIKKYLGEKIEAGDKLVIKGDITDRWGMLVVYEFAKVDDTRSVPEKGVNTQYREFDMNVTMELVKSGATSGKTIQFTSDSKLMYVMDIDYDYKGKKYSELDSDSPCTITYSKESFDIGSGSSHYTVDGNDYSVSFKGNRPDKEDTTADIKTAKDMSEMMSTFRAEIAAIPDSSGSATVDKTYDAAKDVFSDLVVDVVGKEVLDFILIIIGGFVGFVVILAIVIIVIIAIKKCK